MEIPQRFVVNERSAVSLQQATTRDDRLQHIWNGWTYSLATLNRDSEVTTLLDSGNV